MLDGMGSKMLVGTPLFEKRGQAHIWALRAGGKCTQELETERLSRRDLQAGGFSAVRMQDGVCNAREGLLMRVCQGM